MYSDVLKQFPPSLSLLRNSLVIFVIYIVCFYHCAPFIVYHTIFKFDENFLFQIVHKNKTIHAYRFIGGRGGIVKLRTTAPPPYYKRQAYIVDVYIFFFTIKPTTITVFSNDTCISYKFKYQLKRKNN